MIRQLPRRATTVWVVLVALTCATFWLGTDHPIADVSVRLGSAIVMALAFVKVYFIGHDFMEIREAPVALRAAFAAWLVVVGSASILMYTL